MKSNLVKKIYYPNNHNFINYMYKLEIVQLFIKYQCYSSNNHTLTKIYKTFPIHFINIYGKITIN
jgi:thiamine kinase-like enzyme